MEECVDAILVLKQLIPRRRRIERRGEGGQQVQHARLPLLVLERVQHEQRGQVHSANGSVARRIGPARAPAEANVGRTTGHVGGQLQLQRLLSRSSRGRIVATRLSAQMRLQRLQRQHAHDERAARRQLPGQVVQRGQHVQQQQAALAHFAL